MPFQFQGRLFNYFDAKGNTTWANERRVEVPLGKEFLELHEGQKILEVGNVLRHYSPNYTHDVVDLHEKLGWPNLMNHDVLTWSPAKKYDAIMSLSTLEHTVDPLSALERVLSWAPKVLVSLPLGYKRNNYRRGIHCITEIVEAQDWKAKKWGGVQVLFLRRKIPSNLWEQVSFDRVHKASYDPKFKATAVAIWRKGY